MSDSRTRPATIAAKFIADTIVVCVLWRNVVRVDPRQTPTSHSTSSSSPKVPMNISLAAAPIVSLLAGILILVVPRMLNYIVAIYLIVIGVLGLFPHIR